MIYSKRFKGLYLLCLTLLLAHAGFSQVPPTISIRFGNPDFNEETNTLCVDVEYQSDQPGQQIFGTNIRFYYQNDVLGFIDFRDFQGDYAPVMPSPPVVQTGAPSFSPFFGFYSGEVLDFVNGAIQLISQGSDPIMLPDNGDWVKLFQICFAVNPEKVIDPEFFCPTIIWDLEQNPDNGGFQQASDGVVITVVNADPNFESAPAKERVIQFNWDYIGSGSAPYGNPQSYDCVRVGEPHEMPLMGPWSKLTLGAILLVTLIVTGLKRNVFYC